MPGRGLKEFKQPGPTAQVAFERGQEVYSTIREMLESLRREHGLFSGRDWAAGIARIAPHVGTIVDLVREFRRRFNAAKRSLGAVDFSDLERRTLRLLCD